MTYNWRKTFSDTHGCYGTVRPKSLRHHFVGVMLYTVFILLRCKIAAELQVVLFYLFPEVLLWTVTFQRPKVPIGRTGSMDKDRTFAHLVILKNFKEFFLLIF